ncbi:uncharacterized protein EMH_0019010 [Eimeria mitis]|uniref:Uncharacterized protein n=1 Tax=Eimeria mitis TaxID=44415 RepID=U6KD20_9EIME|nr:uncharacterized protein EMH_0019010 [Eimeria mitis]CDJ34152.1 hypothetical protein EMH_0019010 [Eimeria mitis]
MLTTWEQFDDFITEGFGTTPVVTTIRKVKEIQYNGNFEEVVERFSSVRGEGEQLPKETLKDFFLSRFPYDMVKRVLKHEFASGVEIREQTLAERALVANRSATWYEYATGKFRQEVKGRDELIREAWVVNSKPANSPMTCKQDKRQTHKGADDEKVQAFEGWHSAELKGLPVRGGEVEALVDTGVVNTPYNHGSNAVLVVK